MANAAPHRSGLRNGTVNCEDTIIATAIGNCKTKERNLQYLNTTETDTAQTAKDTGQRPFPI